MTDFSTFISPIHTFQFAGNTFEKRKVIEKKRGSVKDIYITK